MGILNNLFGGQTNSSNSYEKISVFDTVEILSDALNTENSLLESETSQEDEEIKEYIQERNSASTNEGFAFNALFNNYTFDNAAYDNGDLVDILFNQYIQVLENINCKPIIYVDDEETMTSGAIFELIDCSSTYRHKCADFLKKDIPIKNCEEYITINVHAENIEAFMEKYATPVAVINSSEEMTYRDLLKILDKKPTGIIKEKRVQPFFLINMSKILIDVIDTVNQTNKKLAKISVNKIYEDYGEEYMEWFGSDVEKWAKNTPYLNVETPLFHIDSSLRQTYNDDYSFGTNYSFVFNEILSKYEDYADDDDDNCEIDDIDLDSFLGLDDDDDNCDLDLGLDFGFDDDNDCD